MTVNFEGTTSLLSNVVLLGWKYCNSLYFDTLHTGLENMKHFKIAIKIIIRYQNRATLLLFSLPSTDFLQDCVITLPYQSHLLTMQIPPKKNNILLLPKEQLNFYNAKTALS